MPTHRLLLSGLLSVAFLAARLAAQQPSALPASVTPAQARAEMKDALRWLVTAQEAYWFKHDSYTTDLAAIREAVEKKPAKDVVLSVHHAGGRAWAASAEHRGLSGQTCVIYVGSLEDFPAPVTRKDNLRPRAFEVGMPLCDGP
jgi:hypothetical protein